MDRTDCSSPATSALTLWSRQGDGAGRGLYLLCAFAFGGYSIAMGASSEMAPHKVWALFAVLGYSGCAVLLALRRSLRSALVCNVALCVAVPFVVLIGRNLMQHEVPIVVTGAVRVLGSGSPYATNPSEVNDVFPYFPLMSAFGLPAAYFGDQPLTDPRILFTLAFLSAMWMAVRRITTHTVVPRVIALVSACPLIAIPVTTGGVDLPIVGLAALAIATTFTGERQLNAVIVGLGCAIKFTFWPLAVMIVVIALRRRDRGVLLWSAIVCGIVAVSVAPSVVLNGKGFRRNAIEFPLGLSAIKSPAGRGLLGGPLSDFGTFGVAIIATSLLIAAGLIAWTTLKTSTLTAGNVLLLAAAGYSALFLLAPVSRAGYFALPFVLASLAAAHHITARSRPIKRRDTGAYETGLPHHKPELV